MDLTSLFKLLDAQPFVPFHVDMENGQRIQVTHAENVTIFPHRRIVRQILVYYPDRDDYDIIFPEGITSLHVQARTG